MSYSNASKKNKKSFFNFFVLCILTLVSVLTFTACKLVSDKESSNAVTDADGNVRLIAPAVNFHAYSLDDSNKKIVDENSGSFTWELAYYATNPGDAGLDNDQAAYFSSFYTDAGLTQFYNSGKYGGVRPTRARSQAELERYFIDLGIPVDCSGFTSAGYYGLYKQTETSSYTVIQLYAPNSLNGSVDKGAISYPSYEVVVDGRFYTFKVEVNGLSSNTNSETISANPFEDSTTDHSLFTFSYRVGKSSGSSEDGFIDCPKEFMTYYTGEDGRFYVRFNPRLEAGSTNRYIKVRALPNLSESNQTRANSLYSSTISYEAYSMTFTAYSPNSVDLAYGGLSYNENAYYFHKVKKVNVVDSINAYDYINTLTGVFPEGRQVIVSRTSPLNNQYDYAFQSWTTNTKAENSRIIESTLPAEAVYSVTEGSGSSCIPDAHKTDSTLFNSIERFGSEIDFSSFDSNGDDAISEEEYANFLVEFNEKVKKSYYAKNESRELINDYAEELFIKNDKDYALTGSLVVSSHSDVNGYTFYANYAKVRNFTASGTFFAGDNFFTGNDQYLTGVTIIVFDKDGKKIASGSGSLSDTEIEGRTDHISIVCDGAYFKVTGLEHGDYLYFEKEGSPLIQEDFTPSVSLPYGFHSAQMVQKDVKYLGRTTKVLSFYVNSETYSDRQDLGIIGTQYAEDSNLIVNLYQTAENGDQKQIGSTNLKLLQDGNVGYEIIKSVSSYEDINGYITTNVILSVLLPSNSTLVSYNVDTVESTTALFFTDGSNYYYVSRVYDEVSMNYSAVNGIYQVEFADIPSATSTTANDLYAYVGDDLYVYSHKVSYNDGVTYYYQKVKDSSSTATADSTRIEMVARHVGKDNTSDNTSWTLITYKPLDNSIPIEYTTIEGANPTLKVGSTECTLITSSLNEFLTITNDEVSISTIAYLTDMEHTQTIVISNPSGTATVEGDTTKEETQDIYVYYDIKQVGDVRYLSAPIGKRESAGIDEESNINLYTITLYFSEITNFDALLASKAVMLGEDIAKNPAVKEFYEALGAKLVLNCYYYVKPLGNPEKILLRQYVQEIQKEPTKEPIIIYTYKDDGTEYNAKTDGPIKYVFNGTTKIVYKAQNGKEISVNGIYDASGTSYGSVTSANNRISHIGISDQEIITALSNKGLTPSEYLMKNVIGNINYSYKIHDYDENGACIIYDVYYNGSNYYKITDSILINYGASNNILYLYKYGSIVTVEEDRDIIVPSMMYATKDEVKTLYFGYKDGTNVTLATDVQTKANYKIQAEKTGRELTQSTKNITVYNLETSLVRSAEIATSGVHVTLLGKYIHSSDSENAIVYPSFSSLNTYSEDEAFTLAANKEDSFDHYYSLDYTSRNLVIEGFPGVKLLAGPPYPNPIIYFSVRHKKSDNPVVNVSLNIKEAYFVEVMGTKVATSDSNVIRDFTTYAFKDTITNLSLNDYIDRSYQILDAKTLKPIVPYIKVSDTEYNVYLIDVNNKEYELGIQDVGYNDNDPYIYFTNLVGANGKFVNKVYVKTISDAGVEEFVPLKQDDVVVWKSNAVKVEDVLMYDIHSYYQDKSGLIYFNSGLDTDENMVCIGLEGISAGSTTNPNNAFDYSEVLISGTTSAYRSKTSMIKGASGSELLGYWLDGSIPIINAYNSKEAYFLSGKEACVIVASPQIVLSDDGGYEYIYRFKEWQIYSRYNSETLFYNRGITEKLHEYRYNAILPFTSDEAGYFVMMPVYERVYTVDSATAVIDGAINQGGGVTISYENGEESNVNDSYDDTLYLTEFLPTIYNDKEGYYYGNISATPYLWFTGDFYNGKPIFEKKDNIFAVAYAKKSGLMSTRNNGETVFFFYELETEDSNPDKITAVKPIRILQQLEKDKPGLIEVNNNHGSYSFKYNLEGKATNSIHHFGDYEDFYLKGIYEKDASNNIQYLKDDEGNFILDNGNKIPIYKTLKLEELFNYVFTSNFFYDGITSTTRDQSYKVSLFYDEANGYFYNLDFSKFMGGNIAFGSLLSDLQSLLKSLSKVDFNDVDVNIGDDKLNTILENVINGAIGLVNDVVNEAANIASYVVGFLKDVVNMLSRQAFLFHMLMFNFKFNYHLFNNDSVINGALNILNHFDVINNLLTSSSLYKIPVVKPLTENIKDIILGNIEDVSFFADLSYYLTDSVAKLKTESFRVINRATNPFIDGLYVSSQGSLNSGELVYDENGKLNSTLQFKTAYLDRDSHVVLTAIADNGYRLEGWYVCEYDEEARAWYATDTKVTNSEPNYRDEVLQAYHNTFNGNYYYYTEYSEFIKDLYGNSHTIYYFDSSKKIPAIVPNNMLDKVRGHFINEGTASEPNYVQVYRKGTEYSREYYYDANFSFPVDLDENEEIYEMAHIDAINRIDASLGLYTLSNIPLYRIEDETGIEKFYRVKEDGNVVVDGANIYISKLHSNVRYVAKFIETYTEYIFSENAEDSTIKVEAVFYHNSDAKKAVSGDEDIIIRTDSFGNNKTGYVPEEGDNPAHGDPSLEDLINNSGNATFKNWFNNEVTLESIFNTSSSDASKTLFSEGFQDTFEATIPGQGSQTLNKYISFGQNDKNGLEELKCLVDNGHASTLTPVTSTYRVNAQTDPTLNGRLSLKNMVFDTETTAYVVVSVEAGEELNIHSLGMNPQYNITPLVEPHDRYIEYVDKHSEETEYLYYVLMVTYNRDPQNELAQYIVHPDRAESMAYDVLSGNYLEFYNNHFNIYYALKNENGEYEDKKYFIEGTDYNLVDYPVNIDPADNLKTKNYKYVKLTENFLNSIGINTTDEESKGKEFLDEQDKKGGFKNISIALEFLNRTIQNPGYIKTSYAVLKSADDPTKEENKLKTTSQYFEALKNLKADGKYHFAKQNGSPMLIYAGQLNIINISSLVIYNYSIQTVTLGSSIKHELINEVYVDGGYGDKTYVGTYYDNGGKDILEGDELFTYDVPNADNLPLGSTNVSYVETKVFDTLYTGLEYTKVNGKEDKTKLENLPFVENTVLVFRGAQAPQSSNIAFVGWYEQKYDEDSKTWSELTLMSKDVETPYLSLATADTRIFGIYKSVETISISYNNKEFTVQLQNGGKDSLGNDIVITTDATDPSITTISGSFYYDADVELLISPTAGYRFDRVKTGSNYLTGGIEGSALIFNNGVDGKYITDNSSLKEISDNYNAAKLNETFLLSINLNKTTGTSFTLEAKRIVQLYIEIENNVSKKGDYTYNVKITDGNSGYYLDTSIKNGNDAKLDSTHHNVTATAKERMLIINGYFDADKDDLQITTSLNSGYADTNQIDSWKINGYNKYTNIMPEFKESNVFEIKFRYADDSGKKYLNTDEYFALGEASEPVNSVYYMYARVEGEIKLTVSHTSFDSYNGASDSISVLESASSLMAFDGIEYRIDPSSQNTAIYTNDALKVTGENHFIISGNMNISLSVEKEIIKDGDKLYVFYGWYVDGHIKTRETTLTNFNINYGNGNTIIKAAYREFVKIEFIADNTEGLPEVDLNALEILPEDNKQIIQDVVTNPFYKVVKYYNENGEYETYVVNNESFNIRNNYNNDNYKVVFSIDETELVDQDGSESNNLFEVVAIIDASEIKVTLKPVYNVTLNQSVYSSVATSNAPTIESSSNETFKIVVGESLKLYKDGTIEIPVSHNIRVILPLDDHYFVGWFNNGNLIELNNADHPDYIEYLPESSMVLEARFVPAKTLIINNSANLSINKISYTIYYMQKEGSTDLTPITVELYNGNGSPSSSYAKIPSGATISIETAEEGASPYFTGWTLITNEATNDKIYLSTSKDVSFLFDEKLTTTNINLTAEFIEYAEVTIQKSFSDDTLDPKEYVYANVKVEYTNKYGILSTATLTTDDAMTLQVSVGTTIKCTPTVTSSLVGKYKAEELTSKIENKDAKTYTIVFNKIKMITISTELNDSLEPTGLVSYKNDSTEYSINNSITEIEVDTSNSLILRIKPENNTKLVGIYKNGDPINISNTSKVDGCYQYTISNITNVNSILIKFIKIVKFTVKTNYEYAKIKIVGNIVESPTPSSTDLGTAVTQTTEELDLTYNSESSRYESSVYILAGSPVVYTAENTSTHVVTNLTNNASKFTAPNGDVAKEVTYGKVTPINCTVVTLGPTVSSVGGTYTLSKNFFTHGSDSVNLSATANNGYKLVYAYKEYDYIDNDGNDTKINLYNGSTDSISTSISNPGAPLDIVLVFAQVLTHSLQVQLDNNSPIAATGSFVQITGCSHTYDSISHLYYESSSISVSAKSEYTDNATKYVFDGWYLDGTKYNEFPTNKLTEGNKTIIAKYVVDSGSTGSGGSTNTASVNETNSVSPLASNEEKTYNLLNTERISNSIIIKTTATNFSSLIEIDNNSNSNYSISYPAGATYNHNTTNYAISYYEYTVNVDDNRIGTVPCTTKYTAPNTITIADTSTSSTINVSIDKGSASSTIVSNAQNNLTSPAVIHLSANIAGGEYFYAYEINGAIHEFPSLSLTISQSTTIKVLIYSNAPTFEYDKNQGSVEILSSEDASGNYEFEVNAYDTYRIKSIKVGSVEKLSPGEITTSKTISLTSVERGQTITIEFARIITLDLEIRSQSSTETKEIILGLGASVNSYDNGELTESELNSIVDGILGSSFNGSYELWYNNNEFTSVNYSNLTRFSIVVKLIETITVKFEFKISSNSLNMDFGSPTNGFRLVYETYAEFDANALASKTFEYNYTERKWFSAYDANEYYDFSHYLIGSKTIDSKTLILTSDLFNGLTVDADGAFTIQVHFVEKYQQITFDYKYNILEEDLGLALKLVIDGTELNGEDNTTYEFTGLGKIYFIKNKTVNIVNDYILYYSPNLAKVDLGAHSITIKDTNFINNTNNKPFGVELDSVTVRSILGVDTTYEKTVNDNIIRFNQFYENTNTAVGDKYSPIYTVNLSTLTNIKEFKVTATAVRLRKVEFSFTNADAILGQDINLSLGVTKLDDDKVVTSFNLKSFSTTTSPYPILSMYVEDNMIVHATIDIANGELQRLFNNLLVSSNSSEMLSSLLKSYDLGDATKGEAFWKDFVLNNSYVPACQMLANKADLIKFNEFYFSATKDLSILADFYALSEYLRYHVISVQYNPSYTGNVDIVRSEYDNINDIINNLLKNEWDDSNGNGRIDIEGGEWNDSNGNGILEDGEWTDDGDLMVEAGEWIDYDKDKVIDQVKQTISDSELKNSYAPGLVLNLALKNTDFAIIYDGPKNYVIANDNTEVFEKPDEKTKIEGLTLNKGERVTISNIGLVFTELQWWVDDEDNPGHIKPISRYVYTKNISQNLLTKTYDLNLNELTEKYEQYSENIPSNYDKVGYQIIEILTIPDTWQQSYITQLRAYSNLIITSARAEKKVSYATKDVVAYNKGTSSNTVGLPNGDYLALGFDENTSLSDLIENKDKILITVINSETSAVISNIPIVSFNYDDSKLENGYITAAVGLNNMILDVTHVTDINIDKDHKLIISYELQNYISDEDRYIEITDEETGIDKTPIDSFNTLLYYEESTGNWQSLNTNHIAALDQSKKISIQALIPKGYFFKGFLVVSTNYKTETKVMISEDGAVNGVETKISFNNYNLLTNFKFNTKENQIVSATINDVLIDGTTQIYALYEPNVYIVTLTQQEYFEDNLDHENESLRNPYFEIIQEENNGIKEEKLNDEFTEMYGATIKGSLIAQKGEDIKISSTNYQYVTFVGWILDEETYKQGDTEVAVDVGEGVHELVAEKYFTSEYRYHNNNSQNIFRLDYEKYDDGRIGKSLYAYLKEIEEEKEQGGKKVTEKYNTLNVAFAPSTLDPLSSSVKNNLYVFNVKSDMTLYAFYQPLGYNLTLYMSEILATITYEDENKEPKDSRPSIDTYLTYADHVRSQEGWKNPSAGTYSFKYDYGTKDANQDDFDTIIEIADNDPYVYAFNDSDGNPIYQYVLDNKLNITESDDNSGTFKNTDKKYPTKIPSTLIDKELSKSNKYLTYKRTSGSDIAYPVEVAYAGSNPINTKLLIPDESVIPSEGEETPLKEVDLVNGEYLTYVYNSDYVNAGDELYKNGYSYNQAQVAPDGTPIVSNIYNYIDTDHPNRLKSGLFKVTITGMDGTKVYKSEDLKLVTIDPLTGEVSAKLKVFASEYGFPEVVIEMGSPDAYSNNKANDVIMKNSIEIPNYKPTTQAEIGNNKDTQVTGFWLDLYGSEKLDFQDENLVLKDLDVDAILKWEQSSIAVDAFVTIDGLKETKLTGNKSYADYTTRFANLACVTQGDGKDGSCNKSPKSTLDPHKYEINAYFIIAVENGKVILDKLYKIQDSATDSSQINAINALIEIIETAKAGNLQEGSITVSGISNLSTGQLLDDDYRNNLIAILQQYFPEEFSFINPETFLRYRAVNVLEYFAGGINRNFIGNYANSYDLILTQVLLAEHARGQYDNKYLFGITEVYNIFTGKYDATTPLSGKQGMDYYRNTQLGFVGNIKDSSVREYNTIKYISNNVSTGEGINYFAGIFNGNKRYAGTFNRVINSMIALSREDFRNCYNAGSVSSRCNIITAADQRIQSAYHDWEETPVENIFAFWSNPVALIWEGVTWVGNMFGADWRTGWEVWTNANFKFWD